MRRQMNETANQRVGNVNLLASISDLMTTDSIPFLQIWLKQFHPTCPVSELYRIVDFVLYCRERKLWRNFNGYSTQDRLISLFELVSSYLPRMCLMLRSLPKVLGTSSYMRCVLIFFNSFPKYSYFRIPCPLNNVDSLEKYHRFRRKKRTS